MRPDAAPLAATTEIGRRFARRMTCGQITALLDVEHAIARLGGDALLDTLRADPRLGDKFTAEEITLAVGGGAILGRLSVTFDPAKVTVPKESR